MKLLSAIMLFMFIGSAYPSDTPEDAANKFYSAVLSLPNGPALLSENDLSRLSPFMSKRLVELIRTAFAYDKQYHKDHPDTPSRDGFPGTIYKGPFGDGIPFSSLAEGAKRFTLGKSAKTSTGYRIELRLVYFDSTRPAEKPGEWTDAVLLIKEDNRFVVDDMEFLGASPYGNHGLLSKMLHYRE